MGRGGGGKRAKSSGRKTGPGGAGEMPLEDFAKKVLEAARASETGRFGDNKVFINHVHKAFPDMPLETFKQKLTEANQQRHLNLVRADMVEAMDPADVRNSNTTYMGAEFNFIRTK